MMNKNSKQIIPVGKKDFAYQNEDVDTICVVRGYMPSGYGNKPYLNAEKDKYSHYELHIKKHTSNSLSVILKKFRKDTVEQRKESGETVTADCYQFGSDFATLVNAIFQDSTPFHFEERQHYPESIKEAFKSAYQKRQK